MYFYPSNLKGQGTLFLWVLKDVLTIIMGAVVSAVIMALSGWIIPVVAVSVYAFLTLRLDSELNIAGYIRFAIRHFITAQQLFYWRWDK